MATDAFLQDWWSLGKGYANPPLVSNRSGSISSPVPTSTTGANSPSVEASTLVPSCSEDANKPPPLILEDSQGHISRGRDVDASIGRMAHLRDTEARTFRKRLPFSCSNHGGQKPTSVTTHSLGGGIAGVIEGVQIPFRAL